MKGLPAETDFVVVGAGGRGVRAAMTGRVRDACWCWIRKLRMPGRNSREVAIAGRGQRRRRDYPAPTRHADAGDGLCLPEAVQNPRDRRAGTHRGVDRLGNAVSIGAELNSSLGLEGTSSRNRIPARAGDSTGREFCGRSSQGGRHQEYFHTGIRISTELENR